MEIKMFSLYDQESAAAQSGKKCIFNCVKRFFPELPEFQDFSSQKRMLIAISQSLLAADIVIVAVQSKMYNATKKMLFTALDLETEKNDEVSAVLSESLKTKKIKESAYESNIVFPKGADILPTNSYLNCGFSLTSGGQRIIYMPIDAPKAAEIVFGSLYDYFADMVDLYIANRAYAYRHRAIIKRTVEKLKRHSIKVAFANINGTDFIKAHTKNKESLEECFIFKTEYIKNDEDSIKDFLTKTTRQVMETAHADFGALISKGYTDDENNLFMYIAVTDASGTKTLKVFAEKNEVAADLTAICVDRLMLMLYDYNKLSPSEVVVHERTNPAMQKALLIIISAFVGIATISGIIIAFILK